MTDYNLVDELGDELDDELYTQGVYIGDPEFDNDLKNNYSVLGYQINKLKSRIRKMQTVLNEKEKLFEKIDKGFIHAQLRVIGSYRQGLGLAG